MKVNSNFGKYLDTLKYLGSGSQGVCFLDVNNKRVIKVFHSYFDDELDNIKKEDIMRFSNIFNSTFMWPKDVIELDNNIIGYVMNYSKKKNLYKINPLNVSLNSLINAIYKVYSDIYLLTDKNVVIYDIMYNILYSNGSFKVIDTMDYGYGVTDYSQNRVGFDHEVMCFLVDNYFDNFVEQDKLLNNMYLSRDVSSLEFLIEFRKKLSEYNGKEINYLRDVKRLVKSNNKTLYSRDLL